MYKQKLKDHISLLKLIKADLVNYQDNKGYYTFIEGIDNSFMIAQNQLNDSWMIKEDNPMYEKLDCLFHKMQDTFFEYACLFYGLNKDQLLNKLYA